MNTSIELSKQEKKAIEQLQKLMKTWPKSLWLFNTGTMFVMKCKDNGELAYDSNGSVDRGYVATTIKGVHSEGGDW